MKRVLVIPCLFLALLGLVGFFACVGGIGVGKQKPMVVCYADDVKTLDVGQMSWMNDIRTAMALWEGLATYNLGFIEADTGGGGVVGDIGRREDVYVSSAEEWAMVEWGSGDGAGFCVCVEAGV